MSRPLSVEVWLARVTPSLAQAWRDGIPPSEIDALARLREIERDRRIVQLAVRRSVMASHLGRDLSAGELAPDARGAIVVPAPGMCLSASHHDDVTVLAVTNGAEAIGVDVEPTREADWDAALEEVLTRAELSALEALPAGKRQAAYFTCWTLKEAVMKALGDGLSDRDPKSIEVTLPPAPPRLVSLEDQPVGRPWSLATLVFGCHVCSVAIAGEASVVVERREWPLDLRSAG